MGVGVVRVWLHDWANSLDYGVNRVVSDLLLVSLVPAVSIEVDFEVAPKFEVLLPLYANRLNRTGSGGETNHFALENDDDDDYSSESNGLDNNDNGANDEQRELSRDYAWASNNKKASTQANHQGIKIGCGRLLTNAHQ